MNRLLTDELSLLKPSTSLLLRRASQQLMKKEDRSMVIAGLYAITFDSVTPVSMMTHKGKKPLRCFLWKAYLTWMYPIDLDLVYRLHGLGYTIHQ